MPIHLPTAVILAAGGSVRMGRSKPLLEVRGRTLIAAHIETLSGFADPIVVVLGAGAEAVRAVLPQHVIVVESPNWEATWPADSLQIALEEANVQGPCWVTPVDVPPATQNTLQLLIAAGAPAVPQDQSGRPGHPVLLDAALVGKIRAQAPDGGLRTLLKEVRRVRVDATDVAIDFDDPEAFARWSGG